MKKHGTPQNVDDLYVNLQGRVLANLPRNFTEDELEYLVTINSEILNGILLKIKESPELKFLSKFILIETIPFTTPQSFNHSKQLADFKKKFSGRFSYIFSEINDEHLNDVRHELKPGKNYEVQVYKGVGLPGFEECLKFLQFKKALFVGAQGLSFFWSQVDTSRIKVQDWFVNNHLLSFSHPNRYPMAVINRTGSDDMVSWEFFLLRSGDKKFYLEPGLYLLCFRAKN